MSGDYRSPSDIAPRLPRAALGPPSPGGPPPANSFPDEPTDTTDMMPGDDGMGDQDQPGLGAPNGQSADPQQMIQQLPEALQKLVRWSAMPNICADKEIPAQTLSDMGQRVRVEYEIDKRSRTKWYNKAQSYMKLCLQESEPKNYPWPKASNIIWPLLSMATNDFAAAAYPEIIKGMDVVKGMVIGPDDGRPVLDQQQQPVMDPKSAKPEIDPETGKPKVDPQTGQPVMGQPTKPAYYEQPGSKRERADRVAQHMSWQLLSEEPEWEPDTDMLLRQLPIIGCASRKSYFDPTLGRNRSLLVSMLNLVVNYKARSMETAPRITEEIELHPYEITEKIRTGLYREFEFGQASGEQADSNDPDAAHIFLEQHRRWDLDGDGYAEPYIVTVHKQSQQVVRLVARYDADGIQIDPNNDHRVARIQAIHYYTLYGFIPNPKSAIYSHGWGHLLGPINEAINTSINQMFDAGHQQIIGGGFIGSQLSMHAGPVKMKRGEFKVVNTLGSNIRDAVYIPEYAGPSEVLFALLGKLIDAGRELGGMRDVLQGNQTPASTDPATLYAIMEQGMKAFKDIFKRVRRSLGSEYKKLYKINSKNLPEQGERFQRGDLFITVTRDDYQQTSGVEPVGDPDQVTDIQRMGRATFLAQFKDDPLFNGVEIRRRMLEAGNIDGIPSILIEEPDPPPMFLAEMAQKQADIAKTKAEEVKNHADALLALMQARKLAVESDGQGSVAFFDQQIKAAQIHMEAVSNVIRATQVATDKMRAETERVLSVHSLHHDRLNAAREHQRGNRELDIRDTEAKAALARARRPGGGPS